MKIKIRRYKQNEFNKLVEFMEELNNYIVKIDPLKRCRGLPDYGSNYTKKLLNDTGKNNGLILFAENKSEIVGIVAGIIIKQSKEELLECIPTRLGVILELFVIPEYRSQNVGLKLMKKIEYYFIKEKCDVIRVEVFAPNIGAHKFYNNLGYQDRDIRLLKLVK